MSANKPWDFSNIILQNRAGDYQAQAIASLGESTSKGLMQYAQLKRERDATEGRIEVSWVNPGYGLGSSPTQSGHVLTSGTFTVGYFDFKYGGAI